MGRKLKENSKVSNGYKKKAWKVETDPTLSIFKGSTLILSKTMPKGKIRKRFPVGKFSCMIKHINFYTVFVPDCDIEARKGLELGDIAMSPVLNPGDSRIVLNWGSRPKDLDSYLTVPHSDPAKPDCVINYKNKICNTMKVTQVKLDLDSVSHSKRGGLPETTTLGILTAGKYVFRTTEFGGRNSDGLLNSGAVVTYYAENEQVSFVVGRDGYVSGISWFVFFLDGATGEIKPCDRENCPESLCAGGGYRRKRNGIYEC